MNCKKTLYYVKMSDNVSYRYSSKNGRYVREKAYLVHVSSTR